MSLQKFKVIRSHRGDKHYSVGDTRTARRADVEHLIGKCLAEPAAKKQAAKKKPAKKKPAKKKPAKKKPAKKKQAAKK